MGPAGLGPGAHKGRPNKILKRDANVNKECIRPPSEPKYVINKSFKML